MSKPRAKAWTARIERILKSTLSSSRLEKLLRLFGDQRQERWLQRYRRHVVKKRPEFADWRPAAIADEQTYNELKAKFSADPEAAAEWMLGMWDSDAGDKDTI